MFSSRNRPLDSLGGISLLDSFSPMLCQACLLAAGGIGETIWPHQEGFKMTIRGVVEVVVVVIVIYFAVRFFMKRG
jgi:hypothetical protein